jgi:hypothetical protein
VPGIWVVKGTVNTLVHQNILQKRYHNELLLNTKYKVAQFKLNKIVKTRDSRHVEGQIAEDEPRRIQRNSLRQQGK